MELAHRLVNSDLENSTSPHEDHIKGKSPRGEKGPEKKQRESETFYPSEDRGQKWKIKRWGHMEIQLGYGPPAPPTWQKAPLGHSSKASAPFRTPNFSGTRLFFFMVGVARAQWGHWPSGGAAPTKHRTLTDANLYLKHTHSTPLGMSCLGLSWPQRATQGVNVAQPLSVSEPYVGTGMWANWHGAVQKNHWQQWRVSSIASLDTLSWIERFTMGLKKNSKQPWQFFLVHRNLHILCFLPLCSCLVPFWFSFIS